MHHSTFLDVDTSTGVLLHCDWNVFLLSPFGCLLLLSRLFGCRKKGVWLGVGYWHKEDGNYHYCKKYINTYCILKLWDKSAQFMLALFSLWSCWHIYGGSFWRRGCKLACEPHSCSVCCSRLDLLTSIIYYDLLIFIELWSNEKVLVCKGLSCERLNSLKSSVP